jgi:N-acetylglucosaminyldiphosphoundecaprenol N-acetyl-beta-D-mannosaminyltransferase
VIDCGKRAVLGVDVSVIDYEAAVSRVIEAARTGAPLAVSALAVHGIMTGALDTTHRYRLNHLDLVTPDGQPVRWALRLLHGEQLTSRVYGPDLMLHVCAAAAREGIPIYLYGSRPEVLRLLEQNLKAKFPGLLVGGSASSRFERVSASENADILNRIQSSGAKIVFVGLGCPRQEVWVYENVAQLSLPALAVGAAFDFHAGVSKQPSKWIQDAGLEWLFRLIQEPKRLWRRYLVMNSFYCWYLFLQLTGLRSFHADRDPKPDRPLHYA